MMKKIALFVLLTIAGLGTTLQAQKVAIVDVNAVLESMDDYRQAQEQLDNMADTWRQEISAEYDAIKALYNKYQAEQVLLSNDARKQREDEIVAKEKLARDMQRAKFGPEGELFKRRQELVQPIQDRVFEAIEDYANSRGYDLIFDRSSTSGLIFANDRYDKTAEVKDKLGLK